MTDLLQRLHAAPSGSRELDLAVFEALGWKWRPNPIRGFLLLPDGSLAPDIAPTRSVDDALSLVPEGWWRKLVQHNDGHGYASIGPTAETAKFRCEHAATPALALCIAILLSREVQDG